MNVLHGYEPASVLHFFEEICGIPHISYHEKELSDYCVAFAKERGLYWEQDELGNVIMIKEATKGYEEVEPIIIQGHLDMVGDKIPECQIDMEKEPIEIYVDGDFIKAKGTTLGGDDGMAVAYGLALLDAKDIPHPRLEVVFTVSEEVGLEGATAIDMSCCKAKRLINIDSEDEGVFTAGCAGGLRADCVLPVETKLQRGVLCEIKTAGFLGGHSGIEIDRGRANGNVIVGRFLLTVKEQIPYHVVKMTGGVKDNVIPKNVNVTILVEENRVEELQIQIEKFNQTLKAEYGNFDPDICLELSVQDMQEKQALTEEVRNKLLLMLTCMPNGVQAMNADLPTLVDTSLNLGVVRVDENQIRITFATRSAHESAKKYMSDKLAIFTQLLGGETSYRGMYPGWPYARESELRELCVNTYQNMYGKEPKIEVIHAGLECGILSSKIEGLDCISIGPDMYDVHTPDERISISSVARVWEYIKEILKAK